MKTQRNDLSRVIAAMLAGLAASGTAVANEYASRPLRLCDTSACYLAWRAVDSDEDGVCDADEIVAGTDPYYSLSRPSLKEVVDLASGAMLPSFEAGQGVFVVLPPGLQELAQARRGDDSTAAFPLATGRPKGLAAFGISSELLAKHGIDQEQHGLSIGLTAGNADGPPVPMVGGADWSLVADGADGGKPTDKHTNHGYLDGNKPNTENNRYHQDGCFTMIDGGGNWVTRDKDKNEVDSGKGKDKDTKYVNPDADPDYGSDGPIKATPTAEEQARFRRMRGAAVLTVDAADRPPVSVGDIESPYGTLILTDPDTYVPHGFLIAGWETSKPRVTTAQPETRPDLPVPDVPAGGVPSGSGTSGGGTSDGDSVAPGNDTGGGTFICDGRGC